MNIGKENILSFLVLLFLSTALHAQDELKAFECLVGGKWVSEGIQLGGHKGKKEVEFGWGLDGKIVKVKTSSTDPTTLEFGLRNEGIRSYNTSEKEIQFYEFDRFGGVTTGKVLIDGKNIHYEYEYQGMILRDSWIYINKNEYKFIVGTWQNEAWSQKFVEQVFIRN